MPNQQNPVTSIVPWPVPAGPRVGDRERSQACDELSAQFAAGRLADDELEERLTAAVSARTRADLQRILADLPPLNEHEPARPAPVPPAVPLPLPAAPVAWSALDVLALLALIGCLIVAGGAAMVVIASGYPPIITRGR